MMTTQVAEELYKLAEDLYQQGYQCGFKDHDGWLKAYATAMYMIVNLGVKFNDDLIMQIYNTINEENKDG